MPHWPAPVSVVIFVTPLLRVVERLRARRCSACASRPASPPRTCNRSAPGCRAPAPAGAPGTAARAATAGRRRAPRRGCRRSSSCGDLLQDQVHREQRREVLGADRLRGCPGCSGGGGGDGRSGITLYQRVGISDSSSSDLVLVGHDVPSLGRWRRLATPRGATVRRAVDSARLGMARSRLASTPHADADARRSRDAAGAAAVAGVGGTERPARCRWPRPWRPRWPTASTCWCRRARAPASRWPTWCRRCCTATSPAARPAAVVVATATIALQNQIVERDLPPLVDAVEPLLGRRPTYAILKGRSNYLCQEQGARRDARRRRATRCSTRRRPPRWAATSCGCAAGPTRPRPATATSSTRGSATGPGGRSA